MINISHFFKSEANWHLFLYAILSYNDYDDTEEKQSVTVWNKYKQYVCDEANRNIPGEFANIFLCSCP